MKLNDHEEMYVVFSAFSSTLMSQCFMMPAMRLPLRYMVLWFVSFLPLYTSKFVWLDVGTPVAIVMLPPTS